MKKGPAWLLALLMVLCVPGVSWAHRVHVFAFVDGDAVRVECSFSKSRKVKNGALVVTDRETGAPVCDGKTDEHGLFRFRPDAAFLTAGHGLRITLLAGEGHRGEWELSAEELTALSPPEASARVVAEEKIVAAETVPATPAINAAELEALVGNVMDAKLAPIKQALARQEDRGPDVRDIVGGLGWIIGLCGFAAYAFAARRKP